MQSGLGQLAGRQCSLQISLSLPEHLPDHSAVDWELNAAAAAGKHLTDHRALDRELHTVGNAAVPTPAADRALDREVNTVGNAAVRTAAAGDATAQVAGLRTALACTRPVAARQEYILLTKVAARPKSTKIAPEVVARLERRKLVAQMNLRDEVVPPRTEYFLELLAPDLQLKEYFPETSLQEHSLNEQLGLLVARGNNQDVPHHQSDNNFLPNDCIRGWHCKPACSPTAACFLLGNYPREPSLLVGFQILLWEEVLLVGFQTLLREEGLLLGFQILLREEVGHASQIVAAARTTHFCVGQVAELNQIAPQLQLPVALVELASQIAELNQLAPQLQFPVALVVLASQIPHQTSAAHSCVGDQIVVAQIAAPPSVVHLRHHLSADQLEGLIAVQPQTAIPLKSFPHLPPAVTRNPATPILEAPSLAPPTPVDPNPNRQ